MGRIGLDTRKMPYMDLIPVVLQEKFLEAEILPLPGHMRNPSSSEQRPQQHQIATNRNFYLQDEFWDQTDVVFIGERLIVTQYIQIVYIVKITKRGRSFFNFL